MYHAGQSPYGVTGSVSMYADHQYGVPAFSSIPPQQMVHAIPIGYSGGPQASGFPSQAGLMAMPPAAPSSFIQSDPAVLHDRYVEPGMGYQGDIDVRGSGGGGRAIYMQQAPPQPTRAQPHHLMPGPPPSVPLYSGGGAGGGPMYLSAHPAGEAGYPPHQGGGPRGKSMNHLRGMHSQPQQLMHQHPPQHHQHHQQLQQQQQQPQPPQPLQQQQPQKRRTQRGMEDNIKRTVYVSYIDLQVTEEQLAMSFGECGTVVDCRICGDPNSAMRFAFIEFSTIAEAQQAQVKSGMVLGNSPLRVLPSKTAIVPVSRELMPRSNDEVERCSRTVYVANIDKKVDRGDVRSFFEGLCGPVSKLRLLGDYAHSTRISFIEFQYADSAMAALNCSGALLGSLPIRVSPSKTPVRSEASHKDRRGVQQQQRLLMAPHGSSAGGSQHDDDALYAAEQEQLMAMHLAQTAGTPAEGMQLLEVTLAQQQHQHQVQAQVQQDAQAQLAGPAGSPVLVQAPPSPPLVSAPPPPPATAPAAAAPSLLAPTQPPLPQPEDTPAALFASKYPVIRGRSAHHTPAAAAAAVPAAQPVAEPQVMVLPAATAGLPGSSSAPAPTAVLLPAAAPAMQAVAATQPATATATTVPVDAGMLASQLSQLQVQQTLDATPSAPTCAHPALQAAGNVMAAAPPIIPLTAAPMPAAPVPAAACMGTLDTIAAGLPVPLPMPCEPLGAVPQGHAAGVQPAPTPAGPAASVATDAGVAAPPVALPSVVGKGDVDAAALAATAPTPVAASVEEAAVALSQPTILLTAHAGGVAEGPGAVAAEATESAAPSEALATAPPAPRPMPHAPGEEEPAGATALPPATVAAADAARPADTAQPADTPSSTPPHVPREEQPSQE